MDEIDCKTIVSNSHLFASKQVNILLTILKRCQGAGDDTENETENTDENYKIESYSHRSEGGEGNQNN